MIGNICKDWHSTGSADNKWCILGTNPKAASCPGATKKNDFYWTKHPFICTGKGFQMTKKRQRRTESDITTFENLIQRQKCPLIRECKDRIWYLVDRIALTI